MPTNVVMPQMGESIAEGTIVRWIKKVGDDVDRDEPLFEISTDKVDAEIPSPVAGRLAEILVKEGETVPVNSVVAVIGAAGEAVAEARVSPPEAAPVPAVSAAPPADGRRRETSPSRTIPIQTTLTGRSRRRSCAGSRASTTWTSRRFTAPGSTAA